MAIDTPTQSNYISATLTQPTRTSETLTQPTRTNDILTQPTHAADTQTEPTHIWGIMFSCYKNTFRVVFSYTYINHASPSRRLCIGHGPICWWEMCKQKVCIQSGHILVELTLHIVR